MYRICGRSDCYFFFSLPNIVTYKFDVSEQLWHLVPGWNSSRVTTSSNLPNTLSLKILFCRNHESREFFIERTVSLVDVPESFLADQIFELQAIHLSLDVVFDNVKSIQNTFIRFFFLMWVQVFRMGLPRICEELSEAYERPLRESAASSPPIISSIRGTATLEHHDISCSSCNKPIVGIRFLCLNCVEEKNFCAKCLTPLHGQLLMNEASPSLLVGSD